MAAHGRLDAVLRADPAARAAGADRRLRRGRRGPAAGLDVDRPRARGRGRALAQEGRPAVRWPSAWSSCCGLRVHRGVRDAVAAADLGPGRHRRCRRGRASSTYVFVLGRRAAPAGEPATGVRRGRTRLPTRLTPTAAPTRPIPTATTRRPDHAPSEPAGGLERQVAVGQAGGSRPAARRRPRRRGRPSSCAPAAAARRGRARPRRRRTPRRASPRPAAIAATRGSRDRGEHARCAGRVSGAQHGQQALLDGGRVERGEQHDQRALPGAAPAPCATMPPQSVSTSAGSSGAIALRPARAAGPRPRRPSTRRAPAGRRRAGRPGRRPGRPARRAAARRPSRRPAGARRRPGPAAVRPVSSTSRTRRSRSGRQVRTIDVGRAGGGPPVDRADVVAGDVLAQRVELGALARAPAARYGRRARAAGPACAGRCRRDGERRQHPHRPRHRVRALPAGQPERAQRAHRHPVGAAGRRAGSARRTVSRRRRSPGRDVERVPRGRRARREGGHASRSTPRTRRPGVAPRAA